MPARASPTLGPRLRTPPKARPPFARAPQPTGKLRPPPLKGPPRPRPPANWRVLPAPLILPIPVPARSPRPSYPPGGSARPLPGPKAPPPPPLAHCQALASAQRPAGRRPTAGEVGRTDSGGHPLPGPPTSFPLVPGSRVATYPAVRRTPMVIWPGPFVLGRFYTDSPTPFE